MSKWSEPEVTHQVRDWYRDLSDDGADAFEAAVELLADKGPTLGRPVVGEVDLSREDKTARDLFGSARHQKFSEIRREVTPERRARIDAIKDAMVEAERLHELRKGLGVTQVEVAGRLGVSQGNVSELERRDDVYVSTLRQYVEALGGRLEFTAVFDEERHRLALGQP